MPRTRQHILGERPRRRYRPAEGIVMIQEEIQAFLAAYEGLDRAEGTVQFCRRKLQRLYQDLPEVTVEAVQAGKIICEQNRQKQIVTVPAYRRSY